MSNQCTLAPLTAPEAGSTLPPKTVALGAPGAIVSVRFLQIKPLDLQMQQQSLHSW